MPQHNTDTPRSQWEQGRCPPWITKVFEGQSPSFSGDESDIESSGTESERAQPHARHSEGESRMVLTSPSMLQQRITELDQQREELKIELQMEVALLQGELQTERETLCRHMQLLQNLQEESKQKVLQRQAERQQERETLEQERSRVEELKKCYAEKEKQVLAQDEGQREQLLLQLQQEKEVMESAVRIFDDMEFRFLERESWIEEEEGESEAEREREVSRQQHAVNTAQERVHQLEKQVKEMEREKDKELNALRQERRELLYTSQRILKKKPLSDWPNITGSVPCVMSLSPLTIHIAAQESTRELVSLPRRRSSYRNKLADRPLSAQGLRMVPDSRAPEALTPPLLLASQRLSNRSSDGPRPGHYNGQAFLSPCSSSSSSRAASPCLGMPDLMEMEQKLREARAERERLLRDREERRRTAAEEMRHRELNSHKVEPVEPQMVSDLEPQPQNSSTHNSPECHFPLSLSPTFDLRAHVEMLGHSVAGCLGLHLSPRRCGGFLTKRGGRVKTWRRRWFLFDLDHRRLAYYTDHDERKLKGVIYFQAIEEVYYDHLRTASTSPRPSLTFCVKTYERLFFLVAPSAEAMRIWMDVIVTATDEHCHY
ncbi:pleckstrin homology-like domain family B member 3 isoform X2 [Scleropages formosus]|uniref:pleckstrin homology-like domain family B member 3 isoform X2 n=1 Tax=Scleropages formosus TaxID=113540 RepID=UPI0008785F2B|nr:pleckstrin homology-like domain family B member 3 isoform X2 [Scleropages formosus]